MEKHYTVKEAACLLDHWESYVGKLIRNGGILAKKYRGQWYIPESEILKRTQNNPFKTVNDISDL